MGVSLGFQSFVLQRFSLWMDVTPGDLVKVSGCLWAERKRRQPLTAAVYPVCQWGYSPHLHTWLKPRPVRLVYISPLLDFPSCPL